MILRDQALLPRLIHHPADGIHVQRRGVRRVAIGAQRSDQCGDMPRLQLVPGKLVDGDVFNAQTVRRILQHIAHGLPAGRG